MFLWPECFTLFSLLIPNFRSLPSAQNSHPNSATQSSLSTLISRERERGERFSYCTALMESLNGAVEPVPSCSQEDQGRFSPPQERISKLLSQWTALQMAVQNEWGGCDSLEKSEQLAHEVLSWLFQSKGKIPFPRFRDTFQIFSITYYLKKYKRSLCNSYSKKLRVVLAIQ